VPSDFAASERSFNSIPGFTAEESRRTSQVSSEAFANFNKSFSDFRVNAIVGHYYSQNDRKDANVGVSNLVVPELFNVANRTGELTGSSYMSRIRQMAVFGSLGLSYKGWANLELTGRNEWTSVLAAENRSFFYPGASLSLVLSDAIPTIQNSNTISYLKVRASANKTANADIQPYSLAATFGQASGFPYGTLPGYTAGNQLFDPLLKPEFIYSKELGLEISFLKNRINAEVAYYHQDNTDQIIPVAVSDATGYTTANVNAASFINKGLELDLRLTPLVKLGKFTVDLRANASYNNSEVKQIYQGLDRIFIGGFTDAANYAVVGQPAFVFLASDYKRDSATGKVIVNSATGYPEVDPNTKQFGRTLPTWIVGVNPSIGWNGLNLSVVAEYKGGHNAYHGIGDGMAWTGVSAITARNNRERFVFPNSVYDDGTGKMVENTNVTVANVNDFYTGVFRDVASNFITSAASWRIREVSLGYDIPVKVLGNQQIVKGLNLTLNARNLFLFLPKSNEYSDPDFSFAGSSNSISGAASNNAAGVSTSQINPPTRLFGANLTVTF
jgi:outer membrane receptor protein involved in Fe transport